MGYFEAAKNYLMFLKTGEQKYTEAAAGALQEFEFETEKQPLEEKE